MKQRSIYRPGENPNSRKNLILNKDRTRAELSEMGRRGGTKSGKIKQQRARLQKIMERCLESYMDTFRAAFCDFSEIAEETGIPYHEEPRLVWLVLTLLSFLEDEHKGNLLTPGTLQALGLTDTRAAAILKKWDEAMETTPDPETPLSALCDEWRECMRNIDM